MGSEAGRADEASTVVEAGGHDEAQPEDARAGDVDRGIGGEDGTVFAERERVLGFDPDVGFDSRRLQRSAGLGIVITEGAAQGEPGDLRLERSDQVGGEVVQVEERAVPGAHLIKLDLIASGDAEHADLARGVLAGSGRFPRYGVQLMADGVVRTAAAGVLFVVGAAPVAYGAVLVVAPVVATLVAISPRAVGHALTGAPDGVLRERLGGLVAASATGQLLANVGPIAMAALADESQQSLSGRFVYAVTIARIPLFLFAAVQAVFLPALAALLARRDGPGFASTVRRAVVATAALGAAGVLGVWVLGDWAMGTVYGPKYHLDPTVLALVAASGALFMLAQVSAQGLLAHHADGAVALGWTGGLVATVAALALPGDLATRVAVALCVGSAVAAVTHALVLRGVHRSWVGEATR